MTAKMMVYETKMRKASKVVKTTTTTTTTAANRGEKSRMKTMTAGGKQG